MGATRHSRCLAQGARRPGARGEDPRHHRAEPLVSGQEAQDPGAHDRRQSRSRMSSLAEAAAELIARVTRLEGPVLAVLERLLVVAGALLPGFLASRRLVRVIPRLLRHVEASADDPGRAQRAHTLAPLLKNVALYALSFTVAMIILQEMGVDMRAVFVSAGVLGLAVGFGAQALIKDVIAGFFMLFEGLVRVGDVIEVGAHTGTVESIGLRVTT